MSAPTTVVTLPELVAKWRTWQRGKSLSERTITERTSIVMRCAQWNERAPEYLDADQISAWLAHDQSWSARTRSSYYTNLTAWFRWLEIKEYRTDNPMSGEQVGRPKRVRSTPRPITNEQARRLWSASFYRRRTRAMIALAMFQGLRVHEIAKVKAEHLDLVGRTIVVTGKGGFTATLPLHHLVVEVAYSMPREGFWFPGSDHGHQRRESVGATIAEAMHRVDINGSAHQLRHWFGTALVRAGVDLRTTQTLMRHSELSSTAIYTAVADEARAEGIQRLDPFSVHAQADRAPDDGGTA